MATPREDFLAALNHEETPITPYGISFLEEPAERMNTLIGPDWRDRVVQYRASWALTVEKTLIDEARSLYRDEFGCIWQFGSIWHITESPLKEPTLDGYTWPDLHNVERYEKLLPMCAENPDRYRIAHLGVSLFEQYWKLRGWEGLTDFAAEPAFAEELLDNFLDIMLRTIDRIGDADVDCIGLSDDQSDQRGVTIGAPRWRQMLKPRFSKLFERIHATGRKTFLHCCGNCMEIVPDLIEIGLDYLNPLQPECMDIYTLKREYGRDLLLEGGIGTQQLLPFGTPEDIRAEVARLRRELGKGGGYFLAPTKAVRPETPDANMVALYEAIVEQNAL